MSRETGCHCTHKQHTKASTSEDQVGKFQFHTFSKWLGSLYLAHKAELTVERLVLADLLIELPTFSQSALQVRTQLLIKPLVTLFDGTS